jgi:lipopolysaccharide/colanic/teichoic acid biosynthesis glycosyltransferase
MHVNAGLLLEALLKDDPSAKAEWEETRKLRNDPRVTRPGRFLRSSSLDELPQVFNVLMGHMSLVGPRPVMLDEIERYGVAEPLYLRVQPGMTGLTQVSGRSRLSYDQRVRLDTYYVRNWSIWLDLVLIARTFGSVLRGHGAY